MSPDLIALGRTVRRARRELELSQEALAAIAGMGAKHLGEIERGNHDPRFTTILKLARALDLRPGELLALSEDEREFPGRRRLRS
jgi:transcriptional regulator with XRE-family HTH domain